MDLNNDEVVKILLDAGADPDIKDKKGKSPLDYNYEVLGRGREGVTNRSKTIIKAKLLEYGATENPHRERARKARARKERERKATKRKATTK